MSEITTVHLNEQQRDLLSHLFGDLLDGWAYIGYHDTDVYSDKVKLTDDGLRLLAEIDKQIVHDGVTIQDSYFDYFEEIK